METEMILRLVAITIAAALLLSNFDYSPVLSYVKNFLKRRKPEVIVVDNEETTDFLDVVESWNTLRNQCKELELVSALEKLDEVFPLLNVEE